MFMRKERRKLLSFITTFIFVFNLMSIFITERAYALENEVVLSIEKSVDKSTVYSGEEFTYTIKYSNPNTTTDARNVVLTDVLPSNISFVSLISSPHVDHTQVENVSGHDVVKFIFKDPLQAGSTGILKITAKFPEGKTLAMVDGKPNTATNVAVIKPDNGTEVTSNAVVVTPQVKASDWSVSKVIKTPAATPAIGQPVTYEIQIKGNGSMGGLDLTNIRVADTLPAGATYVSSSNEGIYDVDKGTVNWTIDSVPAGSIIRRTVTVIYPEDKFAIGNNVTNKVDVTAKPYGGGTDEKKSATVSHGFSLPKLDVSNFNKNGRQANDRYSVGQTARFTLSGIENRGNVPLDSMEILDPIPAEIKLTEISTGSYSDQVNLSIEYKTNKRDWENWNIGSFNYTENKKLQVSDLNLDGDEFITQVKWVLSNALEGIPSGFTNYSSIEVNGLVSKPASGNQITNTATLTATHGSDKAVKNASKTIYVIEEMPWLSPSKWAVNPITNAAQTSFDMKDYVKYNLRIQNNSLATGGYINPIAVDVVPVEFEDISGISWNKGNSSITEEPQVDTTSTVAIGGKTYKLIKWSFNGTLKPGEYVDVSYIAKIKDRTVTGLITNNFYITTNDQDKFENDSELISDVNDLDGDGKTADRLAAASCDIFVKFQGALDAKKLVKGELDSQWGEYETIGNTLPGGITDYRLVVKNSGSNGPISNIVVIDQLPNLGDTGLLDPKPRDSKWRPYLVNKITGENGGSLPAGVKVYYSTNANPSKEELRDPINKKGQGGDGWSETPPADITSVKSLKFDFGGIALQPDKEIILEWPMRAPVKAPAGEIAWNSFGFGASYPDYLAGKVVQQNFLPSEPKKVGFEVKPQPDAKYNIGDFVWEDLNRNGIQDNGEPGINGILVNLYNEGEDTPIAYTRTGTDHLGKDGYYLFPNLAPGHYRVEFVFPKDYKPTLSYVGADKEKDSNIKAANVTTKLDNGFEKYSVLTDEIVLNAGDDKSIDAGLYKLASLGDYVWNDSNANGIQDGGEKGIAEVKVILLNEDGTTAKHGDDSEVAPQTTDANGKYLFSNLEPGRYKVKFENPNGYFKFSDAHKGGDTGRDSDGIVSGDNLTATTDVIVLKSGESNITIDQGMYLGVLGDYVWNDLNADGIQDAGEKGIAGVVVKLTDSNGNPVKNAFGAVIASVNTDANGKYSFTNLIPGTYRVEFVKPLAYDKFSPLLAGANDAVNSHADRDTGKTGDITLSAGERNLKQDAGMYKLASLGDLVWLDKNKNGLQDSGEPGMAGITVKLLDKNGFEIKSTTTDSNGKYSFIGLEPGIYSVQFLNDKNYYKLTDQYKGDVNRDSNANKLTGKTEAITLQSGDVNNSIDAGYIVNTGIVIEKTVYAGHDNGKGTGAEEAIGEKGTPITYLFKITNTGDTYLKNLEVTDITLGINVSAMTKLTGDDILAPGASVSYYYETTINGTLTNQVSTAGTPSEGDGTTIPGLDKPTSNDDAKVVQVNPGIDVQKTVYSGNYSLGNAEKEVVSGMPGEAVTYIFKVTNTGDTYLNNIELNDITLGIDKSSMTKISGEEPLAPGSSIFFYYETTIAKDLQNTVEVTGTPTDKDGKVIPNTHKPEDRDTANVKALGSIGDYVWYDNNGDGVQDPVEKGIVGVTLRLLDGNGNAVLDDDGNPITAVTDANGKYLFHRLTPGEYTVELDSSSLPEGLKQTYELDSTFDGSVKVTLSPAQAIDTVDFGYYKLGAIGDYVWKDLNANGIQDPDESGIEGIIVKLYKEDGTLLATTTTDKDGHYRFDKLILGKYYVEFVKPEGYLYSKSKATEDVQLDSNANKKGKTDIITVAAGTYDMSWDAGLYIPSSIGDYVWYDNNGDGVQDAGEKGIEGVTLKLLDGSGNPVLDDEGKPRKAVTDSEGKYLFEGLTPGEYTVVIDSSTLPEGLKQTYELDNNFDGSVKVVLEPEQAIDTVDFGYYKLGAIGDFVWKDNNRNGIQDFGAKGMSNITVKLYKEDGTLVATTTTDKAGYYKFDKLTIGKYYLEFVKPEGYDFSKKYNGTNKELDSNVNSEGKTDIITVEAGTYDMSYDVGLFDIAREDLIDIPDDLEPLGPAIIPTDNLPKTGMPYLDVILMGSITSVLIGALLLLWDSKKNNM